MRIHILSQESDVLLESRVIEVFDRLDRLVQSCLIPIDLRQIISLCSIFLRVELLGLGENPTLEVFALLKF